jgi:hypothetical protein
MSRSHDSPSLRNNGDIQKISDSTENKSQAEKLVLIVLVACSLYDEITTSAAYVFSSLIKQSNKIDYDRVKILFKVKVFMFFLSYHTLT